MEAVFASMELAGFGFFVCLWVASVVWTARDAARRCGNSSLGFVSTAAAVFLPFVGAGLYVLTRPCEQRSDVRARRLRIQMLEAALTDAHERCPECATPIEPEFRCCPTCGEHLRTPCPSCGGLVGILWAACPWCAKALQAEEDSSLSEVA